jgi:hypothetical protein
MAGGHAVSVGEFRRQLHKPNASKSSKYKDKSHIKSEVDARPMHNNQLKFL